jgi:hypothetical protein
MISINKKAAALMLGLVLMLAAVVPASAQSRFGGSMSNKEKIVTIGGAAAAGALIGAIAGGKKGAVIGGMIGGGAGAGVVYIKGKREEDRWERYDRWDYRSERRARRNWRR